eukprot:TRINITY_DN5128_c0_g1_i2.p1 TRINITY_DN5128_c0_g1~~TRINITY_DN5128_c0_g1_i2.p1  ORF type:complete len:392 (+),score=84.20 TRINITY_DN5128_c0_g1_i2:176-1351(+)
MADLLNEELRFQARPEILSRRENTTAENQVDTEKDKDARAIALRNIQINKEIKEGKMDTKFYRGMNGYATYIDKTEAEISSSKYTGSLGPLRAPSNIRATCRFDFNPSLCKDWHDAGYCGFGDSCIYLHDRGDYKSGWQLEDEWEKDQKKRAQRALQGLPESSDDEVEDDVPQIEVPKTCPICEKKFKHPIQTRCEHFFCESCALNHYSKNKTCFTCKKPLNGIFNDATKSLLKLKEEAEAAEALRNKNGGKNKKREDRVLGTDLGNGAPGRGQDGESDEDRGEIEDETFKDVVFEGEEAERMINNLNNGRSSMDAIVRDKEELRRTYEAEEREEDDDEVNMEKLAKEFKKKSLKQKGFQRTESDWLLQNLNVCVNVYTKFLFGLIKQTSL